MELTGMYEQLGISEKVLKFARETYRSKQI